MRNTILTIVIVAVVGIGLYLLLRSLGNNAEQQASLRQIEINTLTEEY